MKEIVSLIHLRMAFAAFDLVPDLLERHVK